MALLRIRGSATVLQVGGRLGGVFDEDPKRWRLTAEIFKTLGLAAEIATPFFPGSFVALVSALAQPAMNNCNLWVQLSACSSSNWSNAA